ncbi:MAG: hypothetical protein JXQ23_10200 [Clostridia bacterium]|nr:hypothetical protein [Clostridia bacterium]
MSDSNKLLQLKSHYAYSYLALKDRDYYSAIRGFRYSIKNSMEVEKSVIGMICAYSCLGKYIKAMAVFNQYEHLLILNKSFRHLLIHDLSFLLVNDSTSLKKLRDGYLSSMRLGKSMKKTNDFYEGNNANVLSIILLAYWYFMTGRRPKGDTDVFISCLHFPTLDKDFRWKLLRRLSITNKELLEDSMIASKFKSLPKTIDSPDYINQLILSSIYTRDLLQAQERITESKELDHTFSSEVMWNYIRLAVENSEIDETAVFFAKTLLHDGWIDSYVSQTIKYGFENKSAYSAEKDIERLQLFGY